MSGDSCCRSASTLKKSISGYMLKLTTNNLFGISDKNHNWVIEPNPDPISQNYTLHIWEKDYRKWQTDSPDLQTMNEIDKYCDEQEMKVINDRTLLVARYQAGRMTLDELNRICRIGAKNQKKWFRRKRLAGVTKFQKAFISWL